MQPKKQLRMTNRFSHELLVITFKHSLHTPTTANELKKKTETVYKLCLINKALDYSGINCSAQN